ncbi:MAG: dTDP-4-dehydrorhamnose 3,5-epimerase [Bacteroidetes bacterium]|nr:dTDP-4-dehydrorhamnose 3,5-epimerase [Bacteroidota bacterium]
MFRIEQTLLNDIVVLVPDRYRDHRGYFMESYRADQFIAMGLPTDFVQDNHSRSVRNVIRGLHFQVDPPMGKLLRVVRGAIQLVELDVRTGSATYGEHVTLDVTDENARLVWIPPGFANGFCVVSDEADVHYKCTAIYNPSGERSVDPLDPALHIRWKTDAPLLSDKDRLAPTLAELTSA